MTKLIIGNMTGNSMDAIDLVLTRFHNEQMDDICSYTKPYDKNMQERIENLRQQVRNKSRTEILSLQTFRDVHDDYVRQIAECVLKMCTQYGIDPKTIDAIGFHGKTLDHNPPSRAKAEGTQPYTLQMGSGKMLADLTGIRVVYDFRSAPILAGLEGAPLVGFHNEHIAKIEGDGIYYNGGNTSNFALIVHGKNCLSADAGPCNEYIDSFIRTHTNLPYDQDGLIGAKGRIQTDLLARIFDIGRLYYERPLPKSGDPAYYGKDEVFRLLEHSRISFEDTVRTLEYFSAYVAFLALTLIPENIAVPPQFILFGGGWKNPIVRQSLQELLQNRGFVLPEHEQTFAHLLKRFGKIPVLKDSAFGAYMEARLFADMANARLHNQPWIFDNRTAVLCGQIAEPNRMRQFYDDQINRTIKE